MFVIDYGLKKMLDVEVCVFSVAEALLKQNQTIESLMHPQLSILRLTFFKMHPKPHKTCSKIFFRLGRCFVKANITAHLPSAPSPTSILLSFWSLLLFLLSNVPGQRKKKVRLEKYLLEKVSTLRIKASSEKEKYSMAGFGMKIRSKTWAIS